MGLYVGTSPLKEAYIGSPTILSYDFTTSTGGWTPASITSRSSSGFYTSGQWQDGYIIAPSEIFKATPKKIIITYNRLNLNGGTGIYNSFNNATYSLQNPYMYTTSYSKLWSFTSNGTSTQVNVGSSPTGDVTWEMDIDSSTTNRTVTHKVTGLSDLTDNYGVVKACWSGQILFVRIVNRNTSSASLYLKGITIEY